tara:strand:+ start:45 stop:491 length:447 start_codon:yes stop_codon:yes gene_type:complete
VHNQPTAGRDTNPSNPVTTRQIDKLKLRFSSPDKDLVFRFNPHGLPGEETHQPNIFPDNMVRDTIEKYFNLAIEHGLKHGDVQKIIDEDSLGAHAANILKAVPDLLEKANERAVSQYGDFIPLDASLLGDAFAELMSSSAEPTTDKPW